MEIGLSLGANLGNRLFQLQEAKKRIIAAGGIAFTAQSPVYETEPVGVPPDDCKLYFLNAIIIVETARPIPDLMARFQFIERKMGRKPTRKTNAARLIDIDVIYANGLRFSAKAVTVPHPRWAGRRFVVRPLCDVRPELIMPGQTTTVHEILRNLPDKHRVTLSLPANEW